MKLLHLITAAAMTVATTSQAGSITALKRVQVTDGAQLDLLFDGKVARGQVKTEFFNDIIQLSLQDVSVYPAKIFSVKGQDLTKVFAYQYAPKVVRTRLTVKGKADDYKDRLDIRYDGKMITVRIGGAGADQVVSTAAKSSATAAAPVAAKHEAPKKMSGDEKILLDKIVHGTAGANKESSKKSEKLGRTEEVSTLTSGTSGPSLARTIGMLILTLGVFAGAAFLLKRVRMGSGKSGLNGRVGRFIRSGLGSKEKMIDVVANHYLGPKKSIAVVRVGRKLLVLGVTNESINLITQLPDSAGTAEAEAAIAERMEDLVLGEFMTGDDETPQASSDKFTANVAKAAAGAAAQSRYGAAAVVAGKPVFADLLNSEQSKPSVRSQIKRRLEGMKQL